MKDINPGTANSETFVAQNRMADVNGLTFFWAYEPAHGIELWMTDGSGDGTAMVSDLYPATQNTGVTRGRFLKGIGSRLYFAATDAVSGEELWMLEVPRRPVSQLEHVPGSIVLSTTGEPGQTR